MSRLLSLTLLLALAGAAPAQQEPLVKKVKSSIAKGVAFLVKQQNGNGGWGDIDKDKDAYAGGPTALALLALLNCDDLLHDEPKLEAERKASIRRGLENLRAVESGRVYVRALQTMALAEAGDKKDYAQIKKNVDWLLQARVYFKGDFIGWFYTNNPGNIQADASNSQYAMLALWYARQAGMPIDRKVWLDVRSYYASTQQKDGSWTYSLTFEPPEDLKGPSQTMTVAGLCGLLIAGMELNADRESWPPAGKVANCGNYPDHAATALAMHWVGKHFTLQLNHRTFYHLYGIERAGRLSGERFFGQHDWYREGCKYLTEKQLPDGSWLEREGRWDRWPHVNVSFALLFLSKGRTPVLISKLVHGNFPRRADDTDWNNDRHDLKNLTDYLARQPDLFGKKPLGWQTYDIKRALFTRSDNPDYKDEVAIVADMRQAPILYITGHQSPSGRIQDEETALIKRYVENGGFILTEACCGDPRFDEGIKKWVEETWPGSKLNYLPPTHPVWTCYNRIVPGDPFKLMSVELGCRTVMIYSPQDLSCHWESNRHSDKPTKSAFELGANIIVYATGKTPPRPRLSDIEIAGGPSRIKESRARGAFRIMQVKHSDQWQPAKNAVSNLMEHIHKVTGLDVKLQPTPLVLSDTNVERVQAAKFLYLHGKGEFRVGADLEPLRFTLQNGGMLLADACCGDPVFDKSFRIFVQNLFPKEKLVRVPIDEKDRDRLFSAKLNGEALSAVNIQCRTEPGGKVRPMEPFLEGIQFEGRWVVLYSKYDIGCALERSTAGDCVGYDPDSALRIATAAVRYHVRP